MFTRPSSLQQNCILPLLLRSPRVLSASVCFPGCLIRLLPVPWIFLQLPAELAGKDLRSRAHRIKWEINATATWCHYQNILIRNLKETRQRQRLRCLISLLATYLSFTEDDVCVGCRALVDVWFGNDKQDVLWLANSDPSDPCYLPETKLGHRLQEIRVI